MKKSRGFTLIELLVVTVVIVTLMAIVFRLAGTGGESTARAKTIARLQKLSNALSGYYAAFGSYPPVPLQGRSRDIYTRVDSYGAQSGYGSLGYGIQGTEQNKAKLVDSGNRDRKNEIERQVEAACRAQPVAAGFPYNYKGPEKEVIAALCQQYNVKNYQPISNYGGFNRDSSDWSENNVFMFGLMSFLLPRYQFMLDGEENLYDSISHPNGPWAANNRRPYLLDGSRNYEWKDVQKWTHMGPEHYNDTSSADSDRRAMIESVPSQAVCARGMPNFKNIVTSRPVPTVREFYGVDTEDDGEFGPAPSKWMVISQDGYNRESSYINGTKTVLDGWGEEFYYYSPPPYQSYQLWSSGPNKRTFPPWMEKPAGKENLVNEWISDDIKVGDK
jgi:prepilin-type N-terminal cleavage/methylation domain-containing protein